MRERTLVQPNPDGRLSVSQIRSAQWWSHSDSLQDRAQGTVGGLVDGIAGGPMGTRKIGRDAKTGEFIPVQCLGRFAYGAGAARPYGRAVVVALSKRSDAPRKPRAA